MSAAWAHVLAGGMAVLWGIVLMVLGAVIPMAFPKRGWGLSAEGKAGVVLVLVGLVLFMAGLVTMGGP